MTARLSICIPTYQRPDGLERAMRSVLAAPREILEDVQLVVSDNSPDATSEAVFERLIAEHPGPSRYHRNEPNVGMVGNHNRCIELAEGHYVQILHDDDHLLPGGTEALVETCRASADATLVFGVHVVDPDDHVLQRRTHRRQHLSPPDAVRRLLGHSSYIRFPAMVVRRDVYTELGGFEDDLGGADDLEAWVRIASVHGLSHIDRTTAAYVVHPDASTESMFVEETIEHIEKVFARAREAGILTPREIRHCQADFLHRFILGGTRRALQGRERDEAKARLSLLRLESVRRHGRRWRWLPMELAMQVLTIGARRPA